MSDAVFTLPRPENWKIHGLCNNREQQFYAKDGVTVPLAKLREAAAACSWCPVLQQCRLFTVAEQPEDGVWAGEVFTSSTRLAKVKRVAEAAGVDFVPRSRGPVAECGTVAAYRRHKRKNEGPCWKCQVAQQEKDRERRRNRGIAS